MKKNILTFVKCFFVAIFLSCCSQVNQVDSEGWPSLANATNPSDATESIMHKNVLESHSILQDDKQILLELVQYQDYESVIIVNKDTGETLQEITTEYPINDLMFEDLNSDGFVDLDLVHWGNMNDEYSPYLWNSCSNQFEEVILVGFDILSYHEILDGTVRNWVKESTNSGVIQELFWDMNSLVLLSEESYFLED